MNKIAFLFSGQGAQYTGMGQELYERYTECKQVFNFADEILGRKISDMCFKASNEELARTVNTQPVVFTVNVSILAVLRKYGIIPDVAAGFSLGEYAAYYAAGIFDLLSSFYLVNQRAVAMENGSENGIYGMGAISGDNISNIEYLCEQYEDAWVVNYNTQRQVSISGKKESVNQIIVKAKEQGYHAVELPVSGAFHSPFMKGAAEEFKKCLLQIPANKSKLPIVLNTTGQYFDNEKPIKEIMAEQIISPVKWQQSIETMLASGVNVFIEVGPGKTLYNFTKTIAGTKAVTVLRVEDMETLYNTIDTIYA